MDQEEPKLVDASGRPIVRREPIRKRVWKHLTTRWKTAVVSLAAVLALLAGVLTNLERIIAFIPHWTFPETPPSWRDVDHLPAAIADREWIRLRVRPDRPVAVVSTCRVEPGGRLRIEGHGTLRFAKDIGIHSRGRLELIGKDKGNPLQLCRRETHEAWSGVRVVGEQAGGSRFSNLRIEGGQGVYCDTPHPRSGAKPSITFPTEPVQGSFQGGAVLVAQSHDVQFDDVHFVHNVSRRGGAVFLYDSKTIAFNNCSFVGNEARTREGKPTKSPGGGGGVFAQLVDGVFFRACRFEQNSTADRFSCGGAISAGYQSSLHVRNSSFIRNHAMDRGGAIYLLSLRAENSGEPNEHRPLCTINVCVFHNNSSGIWTPSEDKPKPEKIGWGTSIYLDAGVNLNLYESTFTHEFPYKPIILTEGSRGNPSLLTMNDCTFRVAWHDARQSDLIQTPDLESGGGANISAISIKTLASPIKNDFLNHGFEELTDPRTIDTVVVHHASALYWDDDVPELGFDQAYRDRFLSRHPELRELRGRDRTFHPKFVKEVFEVYGVGPHYMIARDGRIFCLVPEKDKAYHAGVSRMPARFDPNQREDLNQCSIGIELIATSPAADQRIGKPVGCDIPSEGKYPAYTYAQYHALRWLLADVCSRHHIRYVVGHDEIDFDPNRARNPRRDPGKHFLWENVRDEKAKPLLP